MNIRLMIQMAIVSFHISLLAMDMNYEHRNITMINTLDTKIKVQYWQDSPGFEGLHKRVIHIRPGKHKEISMYENKPTIVLTIVNKDFSLQKICDNDNTYVKDNQGLKNIMITISLGKQDGDTVRLQEKNNAAEKIIEVISGFIKK